MCLGIVLPRHKSSPQDWNCARMETKPTWGTQGVGGVQDAVFVCLLASLISSDTNAWLRAGSRCNLKDLRVPEFWGFI